MQLGFHEQASRWCELKMLWAAARIVNVTSGTPFPRQHGVRRQFLLHHHSEEQLSPQRFQLQSTGPNAAITVRCYHWTQMNSFLLGIISDTHGLLRPEALAALQGSHAIIHAGDVGNLAILDQLKTIAPVFAVRGNTDRGDWATNSRSAKPLNSKARS